MFRVSFAIAPCDIATKAKTPGCSSCYYTTCVSSSFCCYLSYCIISIIHSCGFHYYELKLCFPYEKVGYHRTLNNANCLIRRVVESRRLECPPWYTRCREVPVTTTINPSPVPKEHPLRIFDRSVAPVLDVR